MSPLEALLAALKLAEIGADRYEGRVVERERPRIFGGELLAQVLVAAGRTAADATCHALHAHFLLPGDPRDPLEYRVRRVRDGRRFAHRRVTARQGGRDVLLGTVSFTRDVPIAAEHQYERMPDVEGPEGLATELAHREAIADRLPPEHRRWLLTPRAVELRPVRPMPLFAPPRAPATADTWLRATGPLPDDPLVHRAVLAYASDMTLLDIACYPHGRSWIDPETEEASLDHAIWFHRPLRVDEWLLYAQVSPALAGGRAFARGSVFTREGALVASVAQEGLCRIAP